MAGRDMVEELIPERAENQLRVRIYDVHGGRGDAIGVRFEIAACRPEGAEAWVSVHAEEMDELIEMIARAKRLGVDRYREIQTALRKGE